MGEFALMLNASSKFVEMYELINCLGDAGDLVHPALASHHRRVAYLAFRIGEELGFTKDQLNTLVLAGLLHDIGAFSSEERLELIDREPPHVNDHAFRGADLIEGYKPLKQTADIIRYHHVPWSKGESDLYFGERVPLSSHVLHLADRVVASIDDTLGILGQIGHIVFKMEQQKHTIFMPQLIDILKVLGRKEYIWLDLVNNDLEKIISDTIKLETINLDLNGTMDLAKMLASIIDFRSPFTAVHSIGVAKTAEKMAELIGYSENQRKMMLVAGYLHDLGKLAIPNEIMEKPDKLNKDEQNIMRTHTYHTYHMLKHIKPLKEINMWASLHHEKLNGTGYPFKLKAKDYSLRFPYSSSCGCLYCNKRGKTLS